MSLEEEVLTLEKTDSIKKTSSAILTLVQSAQDKLDKFFTMSKVMIFFSKTPLTVFFLFLVLFANWIFPRWVERNDEKYSGRLCLSYFWFYIKKYRIWKSSNSLTSFSLFKTLVGIDYWILLRKGIIVCLKFTLVLRNKAKLKNLKVSLAPQ